MINEALVKGDNDPQLIDVTIGRFFESQVEKYTHNIALIANFQNVKWSWSDLKKQVDRLALGLHKLGLCCGDRLGVWMPTNSEWVVLQYATAKLGIILVTLNPAYRARELEHALNLVGCKAIFLTPEYKTSNYTKMILELCPELVFGKPKKEFPVLSSKRIPSLKYVVQNTTEHFNGMIRFEDIYVSESDVNDNLLNSIMSQLQPDDPINLQFTSGTTGAPKAATLTHKNILNNGFFVGERVKLTPKDRVCIPVPMYHCFGLVMGNLGCMTHGATIVYPSAGFDPEETLKTVEKEQCTVLYGVPTMFVAELNHPNLKKYKLTSLRSGILAGSPCPIEIMKRVISEMNMKEVTIAYGMTETSPVSFQSQITTPVHLRVETVGTVLQHLECKIIGSDGKTVACNTPGELLVKGYSVMKGYWNQPEKTKEAITEDGFMHTGDLATLDEQGYCRIVGRIKDMMIRGGENIYPREIEEYLFTHPDISDVSVVGIPHPLYGEATCACIILKNKNQKGVDVNAIKAFCKGKIAHYKIPDHVVFVDSFPLTVSGKIQKYILRDQLIPKLTKSKL